jgi:hypothetical protein
VSEEQYLSETARERFRKGDRVQNSAAWNGKPFRARVVGFSPKPARVTIIREGTKTRECYHMDFIKKLD